MEYEPLTLTEAKALTERIRRSAEEFRDGILEAFNRRADEVLDYSSWDAYVAAEFPLIPKLDPGKRAAVAKELVLAGMTQMQTARSLGVSDRTIRMDIGRSQIQAGSELEDRAVSLAEQGMNLQEIADELGVDRRHDIVRRNTRVRAARLAVAPGSLPDDSVRHEERTVACSIRKASEVIWEVNYNIEALLSSIYTLSKTDRNKLRHVLSEGLRKLEGYDS